MTRTEHEEQRHSFAHGNCSIGNPDVTREIVDRVADAESILAEAARVVDGPRRDDYGTPRENHTRTARIWSAMLGIEVSPRMVCLLNIAQKLSRDVHCPKRDNLVDMAGYARNAQLVEEQQP